MDCRPLHSVAARVSTESFDDEARWPVASSRARTTSSRYAAVISMGGAAAAAVAAALEPLAGGAFFGFLASAMTSAALSKKSEHQPLVLGVTLAHGRPCGI